MQEPLAPDAAIAAVTAVALTGVTIHALQSGAWLIYLGAHVGFSALCFLWAKGTGSPPRRQAALLAFAVPFLGAIGAAGTLLCAVMEAVFRPRARGFMEWYNDLFPEEDDEAADLLLNRLRAGGDPASGAADLTSFMDAMSFGTIEQKQAVIALIARRFSPAFAPALRRALEDPIPAVRVQAAAAAAAIEAKFAARAMTLERELKSKTAKPDTLRELGRLNADMAKSGILEAARAQAAREKALECYRLALKASPDDAALLSACGELLLAQGDAKAATPYLTKALSQSRGAAATASLLADALMRQNRFNELRAFARTGLGRFTGPDAERERLDQSLSLWARGTA
jgi:tetratricopeptide (TPR) repeat protein